MKDERRSNRYEVNVTRDKEPDNRRKVESQKRGR